MKWSKSSALTVCAILLISYAYSGIEARRLSQKVEEERESTCIQQGRSDCKLIERYHDDCFASSYRTELRIRSFHAGEYDRCMNSKILQGLAETKR